MVFTTLNYWTFSLPSSASQCNTHGIIRWLLNVFRGCEDKCSCLQVSLKAPTSSIYLLPESPLQTHPLICGVTRSHLCWHMTVLLNASTQNDWVAIDTKVTRCLPFHVAVEKVSLIADAEETSASWFMLRMHFKREKARFCRMSTPLRYIWRLVTHILVERLYKCLYSCDHSVNTTWKYFIWNMKMT